MEQLDDYREHALGLRLASVPVPRFGRVRAQVLQRLVGAFGEYIGQQGRGQVLSKQVRSAAMGSFSQGPILGLIAIGPLDMRQARGQEQAFFGGVNGQRR